MTTVQAVIDLLEGWYPPDWAEDWDNPGLQVGDRSAGVEAILCALDPTVQVIREAAEVGASLVLTHHPLIFDPLSGVDVSEPVAAVLAEAIRSGVAVIACHTNADVAKPGVGDALVNALGLAADEPLAPGPGNARGLGRVGEAPPATASDWLGRCLDLLGGSARLIGPPGVVVERVAVCGGSGASLIPVAAELGADLFITGDVKHHAALDALSLGLAVIDAGHHATEWPWVPEVAGRLSDNGLRAIVSRVNTDPFREMT